VGTDANRRHVLIRCDGDSEKRNSEEYMNSVMTAPESISAYGPARSTVQGSLLEPQELQRIHAYWNATLFLSAGMIYLRHNPLLREPLKPEHVKRRLLGHWAPIRV
jgi:XFP N-terminal domain